MTLHGNNISIYYIVVYKFENSVVLLEVMLIVIYNFLYLILYERFSSLHFGISLPSYSSFKSVADPGGPQEAWAPMPKVRAYILHSLAPNKLQPSIKAGRTTIQ